MPFRTSMNQDPKASLNEGFIRVSCTLNMLMWRYINEERDDKSFMGVERVSSPLNSYALFPKYGCVENCVMKLVLRMS